MLGTPNKWAGSSPAHSWHLLFVSIPKLPHIMRHKYGGRRRGPVPRLIRHHRGDGVLPSVSVRALPPGFKLYRAAEAEAGHVVDAG